MRNFAFALALSITVLGCSSSSTPPNMNPVADMTNGGTGGNGSVDGGSKGKATATVAIQVPSDYKGTVRQLLVAAFDKFPVTGPPVGILYQGTPSLSAGQTLHLQGDATGLSGSDYVLAVLYVQGGGQFSPQPGVDYASAPEQVMFTGQAIDLGTLQLVLVPHVDGGP